MTSPALLSTLATYVPTPIAQEIFRNPESFREEPRSRRSLGVILFSDISGFTHLTELLSRPSSKSSNEASRLITTGAEELTFLINQYFTEMIQVSRAFRGQIVKFSGDALTILFPADKTGLEMAARRAGECALAMQAKMSKFATLNTSRGSVALSMKVGIGAGELLECSVGGELGRWEYVVAGEPLVQMAVAEQKAKPGQIFFSAEAWQMVDSYFDGTIIDGTRRFIQLQKSFAPLPPSEVTALHWESLSFEQRQAAKKALEFYVPGAIKVRLTEQADWLAELRRMTTLFVGVGGINYEAPDAGIQLHQFLQDTQKILYRFEGSLNKVSVDDKGTVLLVLFGAPPFSHEDNPKRAVACALDLQAMAKTYSLKMAIGITEGTLFAGPVGAPDRREYTVIGDEVNLAARFMQYGRAGSIVVSERVKERAGNRFVTESLGRIFIKGKAQTQVAFRVKGENQGRAEFLMRYLLTVHPLVGRKSELEQTRRIAARVRAEQLQVLFIRGELGVGKTRLASEMLREWMTDGGVSYGGRGRSYERQIPYRVWREVLLTIFGLNSALSPQRQLARLAASIAELDDPPDQPDFWADRLPLLADVLGLEAPENEFTRSISGQLRRNNTFALIEAILRREAERRPLLILLEDAHWADELSLSLAAYLAKKLQDVPLLLVLVHRATSDDVEQLMQIDDLPNSHIVNLEPLSTQEGYDLIKILVGDAEITEQIQNILLNRSQGNPFFLHEMIGAVLSNLNGQQRNSAGNLSTIELPETIQDVILSRVDRLQETEKLTLKIASVIGTRFDYSLLSAVHPGHYSDSVLSTQLAKLENEKLVRLEIPAPESHYDFRNVTVQEVVYESLLLAQRRQLHGLVGEALEKLVPDEVEQLAFHYSRSDKWQKALLYLKTAGDKARREYANYAAINYYSQYLNYLAEPPKEVKTAGIISSEYWDVLLERTKLYNLIGLRGEELEDLDALGVLSEALQDNYRRALAAKQWADMYTTSGDYDSGLELIERSVQLAEMAKAEKLVGEGYNLWGKLLYIRGDYKTADSYLQRALYIAQKIDDKSAQADCLNSLGIVAQHQADYDVALYFFREAIELWRALGDQVGLGNGKSNVGQIFYHLGRYSSAQEALNESLALHKSIGDRAGEAFAQLHLGKVRRTWGDYSTADELFRQALSVYESIEDRRYQARTLYHLGFLYCRLNHYDEALEFLEKALTILREVNDPWALGRALTYYGWTLAGNGELGKARKTVEEALRLKQDTQQDIAIIEDLVCLGEIALVRNDLSLAETCDRHVFNHFRSRGIEGIEHPAKLFLMCYRVKNRVHQAEQAALILEQGKQYLITQAETIADPPLRHSYLYNVPENQELLNL